MCIGGLATTSELTSSSLRPPRPEPSPADFPGVPPAGQLRVGDADRSAAAERLSAHTAAGRLTIEKLEERLELVHRAVVVDDLAWVERDLRAPSRPRRTGRRPALTVIAVALVVLGVVASIAIGLPIPPPFIAAGLLLWRARTWRRIGYAPIGADLARS
jgi:Domain of unknown function (DUF1707)